VARSSYRPGRDEVRGHDRLPERQETGGHEHDHDHEHEEDAIELSPAVQVEDLGAWKRKLRIEVSAEKVKGQYDKSLRRFAREAQIPGFRKGHVPRQRLLKQFGKVLTEELRLTLVSKAIEEALDANKFTAVSDAKITPVGWEPPPAGEEDAAKAREAQEAEALKAIAVDPEAPLSFEVEIEIKPIFDLPEYKGLKLTRRVRPVTDEDVDDIITSARRSGADYAEVEDGRAEVGDRLTVSARVEVEGETAWQADGAIAHLTDSILIGLPVSARCESVEGTAVGEERTIDVTIPANFEKEDVRGKEGRLVLKLDELKRAVLGPLDDEAAKGLGYEDIAALRANVREQLVRRADAQAREALETEAADQIVKAAGFDVPGGMLVNMAAGQAMRRVVHLARMGFGTDDISGHMDEIRDEALAESDIWLKRYLVLEKIAEAEGIEVSDGELEEEIRRYARSTRRTPVAARNQLEREDRIDSLRNAIRDAKVLNFLVEHADIRDASGEHGGSPEGGGA